MAKEIQHMHFDSVIALSDYLESEWPTWKKSRKSGRGFPNCMEFSEVRKILKRGGDHQPSADRMTAAALDMAKVPAQEFESPQLINAVAGHRPNVGAHLAGSPKSMVRFAPVPQENKAVSLLVDITASGDRAHKTLATRGAAILGVINELQNEGYAVEVTTIVQTRNDRGDEFHATVKIKDFGDTWNPAAIAFMLAEPSFFRRAMFALMNIEQVKHPDSPIAKAGYGLGVPLSKSDQPDYDIVFEGMHSDGGWTPSNAVDKAMTKVYEWLERNKAGEVA